MVDAYDDLDKELMKDNVKLFVKYVKITAQALGIEAVRIKIRRGRCPNDIGNELAHIHLDTEPPTICIMERWIKALPIEKIKDTAVHETAHIIHPNHTSDLYLTIDRILEGSWTPPTGVQVSNGNERIEDEKELPKHKTRKNQCNYYFCHKTKELKTCRLCGERFCKQHRHPRPPGMPRFKSSAKEDRIFMDEWRKNGHPCPKYYKDEKTPAERYLSFGEHQKLRQLELEMRQKMIKSKKQEKLGKIASKKKIPRHQVEVESEKTDESNLESTPEEIKRMKEADEAFLRKMNKEKVGSSEIKEEWKQPSVQPQYRREVVWSPASKEEIRTKTHHRLKIKSKYTKLAIATAFVLLLVGILVWPLITPQTVNINAVFYAIASEDPLKAAARVDYQLVNDAKSIFLKTQDGIKVADLDCKTAGKCVEKPSIAIDNFRLESQDGTQYTYLIEKQTYLLCVEPKNAILTQCSPFEIKEFTFKSDNSQILRDASRFGCPTGYQKKNAVCVKIE